MSIWLLRIAYPIGQSGIPSISSHQSTNAEKTAAISDEMLLSSNKHGKIRARNPSEDCLLLEMFRWIWATWLWYAEFQDVYSLLYLPCRVPSPWVWAKPVTVMGYQHHDLVTYQLTEFIKSDTILGGPNTMRGAFTRWNVRKMFSCWPQARKQRAWLWTALERGCL